MGSRSHRSWGGVGIVGRGGFALAAWFVALGGCTTLVGLDERYETCATAGCDDGNPCTRDTCGTDGTCAHEPDDATVLPQTAFDCRHAVCEGGAPVEIADAKDFDDDGESCTIDSCGANGSKVTHEPLGDGTACKSGKGSGLCQSGTCQVECTAADAEVACDDGNPCTADGCNVGKGFCEHASLDGIALGNESQTPGDCRLGVCQLGKLVIVGDNTDLPEDGNPCTNDVCDEGIPSNPPKPLDVACSVPSDDLAKVCDGNGSCVQCNQPSQCDHLAADDECRKRTCSATGQCGESFTANDTPLGAAFQTAGDCKKKLCDGAGKVKTQNDDNDLPNDNNECTKNVCSNGVPSNPAEAVNTKCGAGGALFCDGAKTCVGCNSDSQCAADTPCQDNYCDNAAKTCKATNGAAGSVPGTLGQTPGDCQQKQCDGLGGVKSVALNTDLPPDDGIQCTLDTCVNGVPSHPPRKVGTACAQDGGIVCNAVGVCVECNTAANCPGAADCKSATCSEAGTCGVVNDAVNSLCDSQTKGDCKSRLCDGNGACTLTANVNDVGSDGNVCTADGCVAGNNVYTPIAAGQTVAGKCDATLGCTTPPCVCDGVAAPNSACKSKTGTACTNGTTCASTFCADGVCCNSACGGGCDRCDANGACQANAIKNNVDPGVCDAANMSESCLTTPCKCDAVGTCRGDVRLQ